MDVLQRTISLGPLNIPIGLAALLLGWLVYRQAGRLIFRGKEERFRNADGIIFTAFFIFLVAWKLSPIVFSLSTVLKNPAAVLYLPGGAAGTAIGAGAAVVYIAVSVFKKKEGRAGFLKDLLSGTAVLVSLIAVFAVAAVILTGRINSAGNTADAEKGGPAPEFSLESLSGERYSLAAYGGRTVVINFWASWCPPCRAEMPELKTFHEEANPEDTVFLSVNLYSSEQKPEDLPEFISRYELSFPVLLDRNGHAAAAYGISSIPTTVVIDGEGNIAAVRKGAVTAGWLRKMTEQ